MTGGKRGYAPHAYALIPNNEGRFVAVHLEKVSFQRAMPADDGGVLSRFVAEHKARAFDRILMALRLRCRRPDGWHPKNATR